jgi:hypothetical protein
VIRFRCSSEWIEKFGGSFFWEMKCHQCVPLWSQEFVLTTKLWARFSTRAGSWSAQHTVAGRSLKGNFAIFYMLAKYVSGDIKYIFTKFYRHISANRKFVILISWQTTIFNEQNVSLPLYLQRKECFTTVTYIRYISDPFYNYVHFILLLMCWKI